MELLLSISFSLHSGLTAQPFAQPDLREKSRRSVPSPS
jgi:hypothetical protein